MVWPAIKLHQLYSLNLYDGLDIILEDLDMLNIDLLKKIVITKELGYIEIIKNLLIIDTEDKTVKVIGNKVNKFTYLVNREGNGDVNIINYECSNSDILTAVEYLYHMYNNLV